MLVKRALGKSKGGRGGENGGKTALHQTAVALRGARETVQSSRTGRGQQEPQLAYNATFMKKAEELFLTVIQVANEGNKEGANRLAGIIRNLAQLITTPHAVIYPTSAIVEHHGTTTAEQTLYCQLKDVSATATGASLQMVAPQPLSIRPSLWEKLAAAFDHKSLVLPMAVRIGVMLMLVTGIAYSFGIHRPYWVPLTCAAVMVGTSGMAAVQRALQRFAGTVVGMLLGNLFLSMNPHGITLAAVVMVLQFIVELVIGRNYGFAVLFITPLALIMAEAGHPEYSHAYYVTARLTDVFLGCLLGLVGTMLLGKRAASLRLPAIIGSTLLREEELLQSMLAGKTSEHERQQLQTALINTRIVYDTSLNEVSRSRTSVEAIWPAVSSVQQLGYTLLGLSGKEQASISQEEKRMLQHAFYELALAFEHRRAPEPLHWPELVAYPEVKQALMTIWERLHVVQGIRQKS
ncbi:UNVERIFIED_CONTAM: putative membrane protein YccC [Brevibacillus sp. OAP136]